MKKYVILSFVFCMFARVSYGVDATNKEEKIILESPLLNLIDGKSFGVEEITFGLILRQRLDIRRRIYGIAQENGQRVGFFEFEGKKVSLLDLCKIESEIEEASEEKKKVFHDLLNFAKEDFIEIAGKYSNDVREIKNILLGLIEEFLEKKKIKESFLLTWGALEAGQEEDNIRRCLITFKDFTRFCIELVGFLEAMAESCPKGKALFINMVKKARQGV